MRCPFCGNEMTPGGLYLTTHPLHPDPIRGVPQADMGYIRTSNKGRMEKYQVPSLCLREWKMLGCVILGLCCSR